MRIYILHLFSAVVMKQLKLIILGDKNPILSLISSKISDRVTWKTVL